MSEWTHWHQVIPATVTVIAHFKDGGEHQVIAWAMIHRNIPAVDEDDTDLLCTDVVGLIMVEGMASLSLVISDEHSGGFSHYVYGPQ